MGKAVLIVLGIVLLFVYAVFDLIATPRERVRYIPKPMWFVVILAHRHRPPAVAARSVANARRPAAAGRSRLAPNPAREAPTTTPTTSEASEPRSPRRLLKRCAGSRVVLHAQRFKSCPFHNVYDARSGFTQAVTARRSPGRAPSASSMHASSSRDLPPA